MSILRRRAGSPTRPVQPPPYPGRSVIINYDIDDPLHWKNKLEKKLQVAHRGDQHNAATDERPSVALNERATPPARPSPVAAGAILTLGELKRKQMHKRRCKLAASGAANYLAENCDNLTTSVQHQQEDVVDQAEISLELRLRSLIEKEHLTMNSFPFIDYRLAPTTSFDTPDPETILHPIIVAVSPENHSMRPPSSMAPDIPCQPPPKPPRSARVNSKFHVYGVQSPGLTGSQSKSERRSPLNSSNSQLEEYLPAEINEISEKMDSELKFSTEAEETSLNSSKNCVERGSNERSPVHLEPILRVRSRSQQLPIASASRKARLFHLERTSGSEPVASGSEAASEARNFICQKRNYPSSTPPLPPVSPENSCSAESPLTAATGFWEVQSSLSDGPNQHDHPLASDGDLDSTAGEPRASSSDEGFCGNSDTSSEDLARKQVLLMCDMQMQLLKALGGASDHQKRNQKDQIPTNLTPRTDTNTHAAHARGPYPRKRSDSLSESETQLRCEMLEDHIATLARNIDYLTDEIQNQQATLRHLQRLPASVPRVRFVEEPEERLRVCPDEDVLTSPRWLPTRTPERSPAFVERTETIFSNPERVTKLTKFFGSEPPLVRLFLKKLGYEKYARLFELEKIGLNELPYMTEDRLRRLGIPMGPRTRILREAQSVMKLQGDPNLYLI